MEDEEEAELYGVSAGNDAKHGDISMGNNDNSLDDGLGEKDEDEVGNENGDDDDGCVVNFLASHSLLLPFLSFDN